MSKAERKDSHQQEKMIVNLVESLNDLLEQTYQMRSSFDDEDGSIQLAIDQAESALEEYSAVVKPASSAAKSKGRDCSF